MTCSVMNCCRPAVAVSTDSKLKYCWKCATRVAERFGWDSVQLIGRLTPPPWQLGEKFDCSFCGVKLVQGLIASGNHCPSCKSSLTKKEEGHGEGQVSGV